MDRNQNTERELDALRRMAMPDAGRRADPAAWLPFRMARIASYGSPSPAPFTPAACSVRVWDVRFIDASFANSAGTQALATNERNTNKTFQAAAPAGLTLGPNYIVALAESNNQWWILRSYGLCSGPSPSPSPG